MTLRSFDFLRRAAWICTEDANLLLLEVQAAKIVWQYLFVSLLFLPDVVKMKCVKGRSLRLARYGVKIDI